MELDFLEIGTSDFDTLIEYSDNKIKGISIEPIKYYLDRLPDKSNCIKINCAISDREGTIDIYYVSPENISKYKLHECCRGCNSVNKQHPTIRRDLINMGFNPDEIFSVDTVPVRLISDVLQEHNVKSINFLKIDTEGHDCIILNSFLNYYDSNNDDGTDDDNGNGENNILPKYIMFESNVLTNIEDIHKTIERCEGLGYHLIYKNDDALLARSCFSDPIENVFLSGYLPSYDPLLLPHENNLEDAKKWCVKNKGGGVTYQYGRYEVRVSKEPKLDLKHPTIKSWISLVI